MHWLTLGLFDSPNEFGMCTLTLVLTSVNQEPVQNKGCTVKEVDILLPLPDVLKIPRKEEIIIGKFLDY